MKTLKNHLGVIFPLLILLFSIEFSVMADRVLSQYENSMTSDYNIIVVSKKELPKDLISAKILAFKELIRLDTTKVVKRVKNEVPERNFKELQNSMPYFYSLKLSIFPSPEIMNKTAKDLEKISGVMRVETFSKTHDKIYRILTIFKLVAQGFTILIALMGVVLIFNQMKIWLFEHRRRISVMADLGAPYWLKSAMLYKLAIVDSAIATIIVCAIYYYLPSMLDLALKDTGINTPSINIFNDSAVLFSASILTSIISVSLVMIRTRQK